MLRTELQLSLPFAIEPDWTLDFLVDSRSWNMPVSLTVDQDELVLNCTWAEGHPYEFSSEEWANSFAEPFRKHIAIAKSVDRFSKQPGNRLLKSEMLRVITEMYKGY
jgi:hypothetical protein